MVYGGPVSDVTLWRYGNTSLENKKNFFGFGSALKSFETTKEKWIV